MRTKADPIEMSPEAIALRLDDVRSLYLLTTSLGQARIIGPTEALPASGKGQRSRR
jgi:hypothetical protein